MIFSKCNKAEGGEDWADSVKKELSAAKHQEEEAKTSGPSEDRERDNKSNRHRKCSHKTEPLQPNWVSIFGAFQSSDKVDTVNNSDDQKQRIADHCVHNV